MFEWELVVQSVTTGEETTVMEWVTEYAPSDDELKQIMHSHSGGDAVAILNLLSPVRMEPAMVTGGFHALSRLGHPLPGHIAV